MLPSQQPVFNWNPGAAGQGGGMYGYANFGNMADALMGNQLGGYLNFGGNLQNAMSQMAMMNLANQQAKLFNNRLNADLGQTSMNSNAVIQAALARALGDVGSAREGRLGISDQLNNPVYQEYLRGNSGVNVANAQNQGALQRIQALPGVLNSLGGIFNLGGTGGGLLGFQGSGGQSATLPQAGSATQMAVNAARPLPQQAEQTATGSPVINQALAALAGRQRNPFQMRAA